MRHKASVNSEKSIKKVLDNAVQKIVELKDAKKIEVAKITAEATELQTAQTEKIKKEADEKIELIKANAKTVVERRMELGIYAENISDKDIDNDDIYTKVKLEKENAELRAKVKNENNDDIVGTTVTRKSELDKASQEITEKAFDPSKRNRIV